MPTADRDLPPGTVDRVSHPPLPEPVPRLDRAAFDELLQAHVVGLVAAAEELGVQARRREARAAAQSFERRARAFADAIDAAGAHIDYERAVVIVGERGTEVTDLTSYEASPFYWQALTGSGQPIYGDDLLASLRAS